MNVKKKIKRFFRQVWELITMCGGPLIMYAGMSLILILLTIGQSLKFNAGSAVWWALSLVVIIGYNALVSYAQGSSSFEMLISGNLRRQTSQDLDVGHKKSRYRLEKEYRVWKGFVAGAILGLIPLVSAIIFGKNQAIIDGVFMEDIKNENSVFGWVFLIFLLLSGWSNVLFILLNTAGAGISYYFCALFAIVPILTSGFMYIAGAYGKRRKSLREQALKEKEALSNEAPKKVNYGGLPGTKPKKRR